MFYYDKSLIATIIITYREYGVNGVEQPRRRAAIMAKGITQEQVDTAADTLLQAGERPTVERIRAFLGTGSPNTVTRMLEVWWQGLGARFTAQQVRMALPEAPTAVADLAGQLWEQALIAAQAQAQTDLADIRAALDAERTDLQNAQQAASAAETAAAAAAETASQAQALAEARLAESQRLIDQQATQLADLGRQRDALAEQVTALDQAANSLRDRLQVQETAAAAERDNWTQHVRTVEDRAHAEVDRAREETKAMRREREAADREHAGAQKTWRQALDTANAAAAEARREAAREQARAQALEQQLAKLADLPATLEATLSRARTSRTRPAKPGAAPRRATSKAKPG